MNKVDTYVKAELYNEANNVTLYMVVVNSQAYAGCPVFLSKEDMDFWLGNEKSLLRPMGIELTYDSDMEFPDKIIAMYENARILKIARGRVWLA